MMSFPGPWFSGRVDGGSSKVIRTLMFYLALLVCWVGGLTLTTCESAPLIFHGLWHDGSWIRPSSDADGAEFSAVRSPNGIMNATTSTPCGVGLIDWACRGVTDEASWCAHLLTLYNRNLNRTDVRSTSIHSVECTVSYKLQTANWCDGVLGCVGRDLWRQFGMSIWLGAPNCNIHVSYLLAFSDAVLQSGFSDWEHTDGHFVDPSSSMTLVRSTNCTDKNTEVYDWRQLGTTILVEASDWIGVLTDYDVTGRYSHHMTVRDNFNETEPGWRQLGTICRFVASNCTTPAWEQVYIDDVIECAAEYDFLYDDTMTVPGWRQLENAIVVGVSNIRYHSADYASFYHVPRAITSLTFVDDGKTGWRRLGTVTLTGTSNCIKDVEYPTYTNEETVERKFGIVSAETLPIWQAAYADETRSDQCDTLDLRGCFTLCMTNTTKNHSEFGDPKILNCIQTRSFQIVPPLSTHDPSTGTMCSIITDVDDLRFATAHGCNSNTYPLKLKESTVALRFACALKPLSSADYLLCNQVVVGPGQIFTQPVPLATTEDIILCIWRNSIRADASYRYSATSTPGKFYDYKFENLLTRQPHCHPSRLLTTLTNDSPTPVSEEDYFYFKLYLPNFCLLGSESAKFFRWLDTHHLIPLFFSPNPQTYTGEQLETRVRTYGGSLQNSYFCWTISECCWAYNSHDTVCDLNRLHTLIYTSEDECYVEANRFTSTLSSDSCTILSFIERETPNTSIPSLFLPSHLSSSPPVCEFVRGDPTQFKTPRDNSNALGGGNFVCATFAFVIILRGIQLCFSHIIRSFLILTTKLKLYGFYKFTSPFLQRLTIRVCKTVLCSTLVTIVAILVWHYPIQLLFALTIISTIVIILQESSWQFLFRSLWLRPLACGILFSALGVNSFQTLFLDLKIEVTYLVHTFDAQALSKSYTTPTFYSEPGFKTDDPKLFLQNRLNWSTQTSPQRINYNSCFFNLNIPERNSVHWDTFYKQRPTGTNSGHENFTFKCRQITTSNYTDHLTLLGQSYFVRMLTFGFFRSHYTYTRRIFKKVVAQNSHKNWTLKRSNLHLVLSTRGDGNCFYRSTSTLLSQQLNCQISPLTIKRWIVGLLWKDRDDTKYANAMRQEFPCSILPDKPESAYANEYKIKIAVGTLCPGKYEYTQLADALRVNIVFVNTDGTIREIFGKQYQRNLTYRFTPGDTIGHVEPIVRFVPDDVKSRNKWYQFDCSNMLPVIEDWEPIKQPPPKKIYSPNRSGLAKKHVVTHADAFGEFYLPTPLSAFNQVQAVETYDFGSLLSENYAEIRYRPATQPSMHVHLQCSLTYHYDTEHHLTKHQPINTTVIERKPPPETNDGKRVGAKRNREGTSTPPHTDHFCNRWLPEIITLGDDDHLIDITTPPTGKMQTDYGLSKNNENPDAREPIDRDCSLLGPNYPTSPGNIPVSLNACLYGPTAELFTPDHHKSCNGITTHQTNRSLTKTWTDSPTPTHTLTTENNRHLDDTTQTELGTSVPSKEISTAPNFDTLKDSLKRSGILIDTLWNLHDECRRPSGSPAAEPTPTNGKCVRRCLREELQQVTPPTGIVSSRVDFFSKHLLANQRHNTSNIACDRNTNPRTGMIPVGSKSQNREPPHNATPVSWTRNNAPPKRKSCDLEKTYDPPQKGLTYVPWSSYTTPELAIQVNNHILEQTSGSNSSTNDCTEGFQLVDRTQLETLFAAWSPDQLGTPKTLVVGGTAADIRKKYDTSRFTVVDLNDVQVCHPNGGVLSRPACAIILSPFATVDVLQKETSYHLVAAVKFDVNDDSICKVAPAPLFSVTGDKRRLIANALKPELAVDQTTQEFRNAERITKLETQVQWLLDQFADPITDPVRTKLEVATRETDERRAASNLRYSGIYSPDLSPNCAFDNPPPKVNVSHRVWDLLSPLHQSISSLADILHAVVERTDPTLETFFRPFLDALKAGRCINIVKALPSNTDSPNEEAAPDIPVCSPATAQSNDHQGNLIKDTNLLPCKTEIVENYSENVDKQPIQPPPVDETGDSTHSLSTKAPVHRLWKSSHHPQARPQTEKQSTDTPSLRTGSVDTRNRSNDIFQLDTKNRAGHRTYPQASIAATRIVTEAINVADDVIFKLTRNQTDSRVSPKPPTPGTRCPGCLPHQPPGSVVKCKCLSFPPFSRAGSRTPPSQLLIHTICGVIRNLHAQWRGDPSNENVMLRMVANIRRLADALTDEDTPNIILVDYTANEWDSKLDEHLLLLETLDVHNCSAEDIKRSKTMLCALASDASRARTAVPDERPLPESYPRTPEVTFCNCNVRPRTHRVRDVVQHFAHHLALRVRLMIFANCPPGDRPVDFTRDFESTMRLIQSAFTPRDYAQRCHDVLSRLRNEWIRCARCTLCNHPYRMLLQWPTPTYAPHVPTDRMLGLGDAFQPIQRVELVAASTPGNLDALEHITHLALDCIQMPETIEQNQTPHRTGNGRPPTLHASKPPLGTGIARDEMISTHMLDGSAKQTRFLHHPSCYYYEIFACSDFQRFVPWHVGRGKASHSDDELEQIVLFYSNKFTFTAERVGTRLCPLKEKVLFPTHIIALTEHDVINPQGQTWSDKVQPLLKAISANSNELLTRKTNFSGLHARTISRWKKDLNIVHAINQLNADCSSLNESVHAAEPCLSSFESALSGSTLPSQFETTPLRHERTGGTKLCAKTGSSRESGRDTDGHDPNVNYPITFCNLLNAFESCGTDIISFFEPLTCGYDKSICQYCDEFVTHSNQIAASGTTELLNTIWERLLVHASNSALERFYANRQIKPLSRCCKSIFRLTRCLIPEQFQTKNLLDGLNCPREDKTWKLNSFRFALTDHRTMQPKLFDYWYFQQLAEKTCDDIPPTSRTGAGAFFIERHCEVTYHPLISSILNNSNPIRYTTIRKMLDEIGRLVNKWIAAEHSMFASNINHLRHATSTFVGAVLAAFACIRQNIQQHKSILCDLLCCSSTCRSSRNAFRTYYSDGNFLLLKNHKDTLTFCSQWRTSELKAVFHDIWIKTGDFIVRTCAINDFADPFLISTPKIHRPSKITSAQEVKSERPPFVTTEAGANDGTHRTGSCKDPQPNTSRHIRKTRAVSAASLQASMPIFLQNRHANVEESIEPLKDFKTRIERWNHLTQYTLVFGQTLICELDKHDLDTADLYQVFPSWIPHRLTVSASNCYAVIRQALLSPWSNAADSFRRATKHNQSYIQDICALSTCCKTLRNDCKRFLNFKQSLVRPGLLLHEFLWDLKQTIDIYNPNLCQTEKWIAQHGMSSLGNRITWPERVGLTISIRSTADPSHMTFISSNYHSPDLRWSFVTDSHICHSSPLTFLFSFPLLTFFGCVTHCETNEIHYLAYPLRSGMDEPDKTKGTEEPARVQKDRKEDPWDTADPWSKKKRANSQGPNQRENGQTRTRSKSRDKEKRAVDPPKNLRRNINALPWSHLTAVEPIFGDAKRIDWLKAEELAHAKQGAAMIDRDKLQEIVSNVLATEVLLIVVGGTLSRDKLQRIYNLRPDVVLPVPSLLVITPSGTHDLKSATILGFNVSNVCLGHLTAVIDATPQKATFELVIEDRSREPAKTKDEWRQLLTVKRALQDVDFNNPRKTEHGYAVTARIEKGPAEKLINLSGKHMIYTRYLLRNGFDPLGDIGIVWFSADNAFELCESLVGFRGLIAPTSKESNNHGARFVIENLAHARSTLRSDLTGKRFNSINASVAGKLTFRIKGFPNGTGPEDLIKLLHESIKWPVIPGKRTSKRWYEEYIVRADTEPSSRVFGTNQGTVVIEALDTTNASAEQPTPAMQDVPEFNIKPDDQKQATFVAEAQQKQKERLEAAIENRLTEERKTVNSRFSAIEQQLQKLTSIQEKSQLDTEAHAKTTTQNIEMLLKAVTEQQSQMTTVCSKLEHVFASQNEVKHIIDRLEIHTRMTDIPSPSRAPSPPHKLSRGGADRRD